jgi:hypothetical protein
MSFLVEAIKFRADVMKTIGYGYILLTSIGAKCIIVAVKLWDMYSCNVKGLNQ